MTRIAINPMRWPLAFKAPLLVAAFMFAISAIITNAVLARLKETQEKHLLAVSATFLNGLSSAVIPHVLREDVWEVFDTIERGSSLEGGFGKASVIVVNSHGETLAATDPRRAPVMSRQGDLDRPFGSNEALVVESEGPRAFARRALTYQDRIIGRIYAEYDISHLLKERSEVLKTLVATNAAIALILAAMGYWATRRMLGPLKVLSNHLDRSVSGPVQRIGDERLGNEAHEFGRLFRRFNLMADAVNEREALAAELAAEERLASLGRLASGMAHEINNPLGGLFNAIDTLKRHGDKPTVRASSVDLIERGLRGIRDVVRSVLAAYRADRDSRNLSQPDIDDLKLLMTPELRRKNLSLIWTNEFEGEIEFPASALRQIVLNLLLNAAHASPQNGSIAVTVRVGGKGFSVEVEDEGPGLPDVARAVLAGASERPITLGDGSGLGLWITRRLIHDLGGSVIVAQSALGGANIHVVIPLRRSGELRHVA